MSLPAFPKWFTESTNDSTSVDSGSSESAMDEMSQADQPVDYSEIIELEAFLGELPFQVIIEGISEQFSNYIGTEDDTDYVDAFYNQLHASYEALEADEGEEHPAEIREALDRLLTRFVSTMKDLFEQRLTLTLMDLEGEEVNQDDVEQAIRCLYDYFILNARENFLQVISKDINAKIKTVIEDDTKYFETIHEMLTSYSPLVTAVGPMQFLRYRNDPEVYELFDSGRVVGNFLRKYSPRLYQFEEFEVEIVNHITVIQQVKEELLNGGK